MQTVWRSSVTARVHQNSLTNHFGVSRLCAPLRTIAPNGDATRLAAQSGHISSYDYNGHDGHTQKATLENVFGRLHLQQSAGQQSSTGYGTAKQPAPWMVGWQVNERNITWNDDLKLRVIKRIASEELGISDEEMEWRLEQLHFLLPDLHQRLAGAPPKLVARLCAHTDTIAYRMLQLKSIFPKADVVAMVNNRLTLVLDDDLDSVKAAAQKLRTLLPKTDVDSFVEQFPVVLDVDSFEVALQDARRLIPNVDIAKMIATDPQMILSLIKGKNLIPYDELANPWS